MGQEKAKDQTGLVEDSVIFTMISYDDGEIIDQGRINNQIDLALRDLS